MSKKVYCEECGTLVLDMQKGKIKPFKAVCEKCSKITPEYDLPEGFNDIFKGFQK